jgi:hypothetical protein
MQRLEVMYIYINVVRQPRVKQGYITKRNENNIDVFDFRWLKQNGQDFGSSSTRRTRSRHPLQRRSAIYREETLLPGYRSEWNTGLAIGSRKRHAEVNCVEVY